jgi:hypothetical protein
MFPDMNLNGFPQCNASPIMADGKPNVHLIRMIFSFHVAKEIFPIDMCEGCLVALGGLPNP